MSMPSDKTNKENWHRIANLEAENAALRARVTELEAVVTQRNNELLAKWQDRVEEKLAAARVEELKSLRDYFRLQDELYHGAADVVECKIAALERGKDGQWTIFRS